MRLLILTQYFPPEMGAPQARLSELGERLIDLGWEVEALTAVPNYPTGRVFDGYRRMRTRVEMIGRIRTARVPLYATKSPRFIKRLASYFSFVATASWFGPRLCGRPDLLLAESPPLFIGYAARYLSWRWQCPYVLNVSDLWPQSVLDIGALKRGFLIRRAEALELVLYRGAAGVTGQSAGIVAHVRQKSPETPTELITNGVDPSRFGPQWVDDAARKVLGAEPGPVFVYAGLLGMAQGLDQLLDVARTLREDPHGRLVLVGDGPCREHLERRIAQELITRARVVGPQPRGRIPAILAAADVAVISLGHSIPGAVPSKIYEAMAASLPILLVADGEPAQRVTRAECGLCVAPGDITAAREAWRRLAGDADLRQRLGAAGHRAAETTYNRKAIATRLDAFLRGLIETAGRSDSSQRNQAIEPPVEAMQERRVER